MSPGSFSVPATEFSLWMISWPQEFRHVSAKECMQTDFINQVPFACAGRAACRDLTVWAHAQLPGFYLKSWMTAEMQ